MDWSNKQEIFNIIKQNEDILKYAPEHIKNDRIFALSVAKINPKGLKYLSYKFFDDVDVMLEAIKKEGPIFDNASQRLKDDYNFTIKAIKQNGEVFEFISPKFKEDKDLILISILNDPYSFRYIPEDIRKNEEFILEVLIKYRKHIEKFLKNHYISIEQLGEMAKNEELCRNMIPYKLRNEEFIIKVIKAYPYIYAELGARYKKKYIITKTALEEDGLNFLFIPKEYKNDRKFIIECLFNNKGSIKGDILDYIHEDLKSKIIKKVKVETDKIIKEKNLMFYFNKNFKDFKTIKSLKNILNLYGIKIEKFIEEII